MEFESILNLVSVLWPADSAIEWLEAKTRVVVATGTTSVDAKLQVAQLGRQGIEKGGRRGGTLI